MEDLIVLAKRISPAEVKEQLLKQIKQSIGDKSWRVRYMAANHFNEVGILSWALIVFNEAACSSQMLLALILCERN